MTWRTTNAESDDVTRMVASEAAWERDIGNRSRRGQRNCLNSSRHFSMMPASRLARPRVELSSGANEGGAAA